MADVIATYFDRMTMIGDSQGIIFTTNAEKYIQS